LGYFGKAPKDARFENESVTALLKGKKGAELKNAVIGAFPELKEQSTELSTQEAARRLIQGVADGMPDEQKETRFMALPTGLDKSVIPMLPERIYIPAAKDLADDTKTAETSSFGKILAIVMKAIEPLLADEKDLFEKLSRKLTRTVDETGKVEDNRLREVRGIESAIQDYVREIFANVSLEIEVPPPELRTLLSSARILADDGMKGPLESKGDGLRRAVVFSILRAYTDVARAAASQAEGGKALERGYLLLFEEPELFLHPDAQQILFEALGLFAKKNHVVVTTHSPFFLGPQTTATFVRLSKVRDKSAEKPFSAAAPVDLTGLAPKDEFQIICYENNSAAFFAKRIVLVDTLWSCWIHS
jgi:putative ATP-dependent endonuclease of the OLD family